MLPTAYATAAINQPPVPTSAKLAVASMPVAAQINSRPLWAWRVSASAPTRGTSRTTMRLAVLLVMPSRKVEVAESAPSFQKPASMTGTKAVMTLSANAELAQS